VPSLIDIRRRIRAVKSTQQITKAMKMVAASKLRRAQERTLSARPFAQQMLRVLNRVASRVPETAHPLLALTTAAAGPGRTLLIVITSDKGLCGSFNTNIIKEAARFITDSAGREVALGLVGRKGRDYFRRRGFDVRYEDVGLFQNIRYTHAQAIARAAIEEFLNGSASSVHLVYNEFKSVMQQRVVVERLLPIPRGEVLVEAAALGWPEQGPGVDYLFEPPPADIFRLLLPRHVEVQVFRALLESAAAEHAARMMAMDSATKNAAEMIDHLTLYMNKVRQAGITREIIEVVSGAQAL
jgi:F-type H+-transporting ATPase subunit gamma